MQITLENFQGHAKSVIETAGGITAITGSTNSGKTSFIRAISHVKNNNLKGTEYIRKGTDKCIVTVDDIQRIKAKSENCYICSGNKTEALRGGVPIEVIQAMNLSDDCIQMQHDAIFLLNKSPGVVASKLAELIDLDIAHRAVKVVDKDRREAYAELNLHTLSIKKHEERIDELAVIDTIDTALSSIEKKWGIINEYKEKQATLQRLIDIAVVRLTELNNLPHIYPLKGCSKLIAKAVSTQADQKALAGVNSLLKTAQQHGIELKGMPDIGKLFGLRDLLNEAADLLVGRVDLENIKGAIAAVNRLATRRLVVPKSIMTLINDVENLDEEIKELNMHVVGAMTNIARIAAHSKKLAQLKAKYKEVMGDKCPMCFSKIKK